MFVHPGPGHGISTALRSRGAAHRGLRRELQRRGRAIEIVVVARTMREIDRARRVIGGWAGAIGSGGSDAGTAEEPAWIEKASSRARSTCSRSSAAFRLP